jgi:hypothetical protein
LGEHLRLDSQVVTLTKISQNHTVVRACRSAEREKLVHFQSGRENLFEVVELGKTSN